METDTDTHPLDQPIIRALACLDTMTPRPANQVACMVWPNRPFKTQQAAGAAIRPVLAKLSWQGLARRNAKGWVRREVLTNE